VQAEFVQDGANSNEIFLGDPHWIGNELGRQRGVGMEIRQLQGQRLRSLMPRQQRQDYAALSAIAYLQTPGHAPASGLGSFGRGIGSHTVEYDLVQLRQPGRVQALGSNVPEPIHRPLNPFADPPQHLNASAAMQAGGTITGSPFPQKRKASVRANQGRTRKG
jgi:hypothetical protein